MSLTAANRQLGRSVSAGLVVIASLFAIAAALFPPGVSTSFAAPAWPVSLGLGVVGLLLTRSTGEGRGTGGGQGNASGLSPSVLDGRDGRLLSGLLTLAPLIPVLGYLVINRADVGALASVLLLLGFASASAFVVVVIPAILSRFVEVRGVQVVCSSWLFVMLNMASVSASREWHGTGSLTVQGLTLAAAIVVLLLLSSSPRQLMLWAVPFYLVLEVGSALLVPVDDPVVAQPDELPSSSVDVPAATAGVWESRPDIHLVIYESYASPATIESYGYDLSEQMALLGAEGFDVHPGTYSLAASSLGSMSRVLEAASVVDRDQREITTGNGEVARVLSEQGYVTAGIFSSDYFYALDGPTWDVNLPGSRSPWEPVVTSVLRGEFRADDSFNNVDYDTYLEAKRELLATSTGPPAFTYTHNRFPGHSQNSGTCLPNEAERYFEGLDLANAEMRADITAANRSDRDAIVILAADHGPYLTKNCTILDGDYDAESVDRLDVQDRYGTFFAVRWPEGMSPERGVRVLQDVMPLIFAELSGDGRFWSESDVAPVTQDTKRTAGVVVDNGIIRGGVHDGEQLFPRR